jgi:hypothetical protein
MFKSAFGTGKWAAPQARQITSSGHTITVESTALDQESQIATSPLNLRRFSEPHEVQDIRVIPRGVSCDRFYDGAGPTHTL